MWAATTFTRWVWPIRRWAASFWPGWTWTFTAMWTFRSRTGPVSSRIRNIQQRRNDTRRRGSRGAWRYGNGRRVTRKWKMWKTLNRTRYNLVPETVSWCEYCNMTNRLYKFPSKLIMIFWIFGQNSPINADANNQRTYLQWNFLNTNYIFILQFLKHFLKFSFKFL